MHTQLSRIYVKMTKVTEHGIELIHLYILF